MLVRVCPSVVAYHKLSLSVCMSCFELSCLSCLSVWILRGLHRTNLVSDLIDTFRKWLVYIICRLSICLFVCLSVRQSLACSNVPSSSPSQKKRKKRNGSNNTDLCISYFLINYLVELCFNLLILRWYFSRF